MITFLQAAQQGDPTQLYLMGAIFIIMIVFFIILPNKQKKKEAKKINDAIAIGKEVVTIGGLHGTVRSIDEVKQTLTLRLVTGEMVIERSAVARVIE